MPRGKGARNIKRKSDTDVVASSSKIKKTLSEDDSISPDIRKSIKDEQVSCDSGSQGAVIHAPGSRLDSMFFNRSCKELAKALLGQTLISIVDKTRVAGKIVETEAYLGPEDKAAHSYNGKRTARNEAMFLCPGTAYVYNIYGMYCCMNISAEENGAAVLIRALQPLENLENMDKLRTKGKEGASLMKKGGQGLCNGPSKLCQALGITKDAVNKVKLQESDSVWLEKGEDIDDKDIVCCKRINIDYAGDWVEKPLRFYVRGNGFVSIKDKDAEKDFG
ncbi:uncharacterized protein LOC127865786 isoform X1 [Dreissena polymorpha]|uniref:DNA-3-methyladenine glycosylase n=1 Tax=Dreissena polymorpha TaxID=45954 RepID=A0A9D4RC19_DREPO|nr:uncharacterized protein LOC127865786 isoform X1 [Dreissena polymorpha]XP_052261708.1 uncharacterized protein LOC127865786 isoform X1 [Dreissena polymorpha]KAH3860790.1 hypothetical protein DPMN_023714 [Dreissena polymorpha]